MTSIRDRINAHLPIVLQFLSTASLVTIALSAVCASQSLKRISNQHAIEGLQPQVNTDMMHNSKMHMD